MPWSVVLPEIVHDAAGAIAGRQSLLQQDIFGILLVHIDRPTDPVLQESIIDTEIGLRRLFPMQVSIGQRRHQERPYLAGPKPDRNCRCWCLIIPVCCKALLPGWT